MRIVLVVPPISVLILRRLGFQVLFWWLYELLTVLPCPVCFPQTSQLLDISLTYLFNLIWVLQYYRNNASLSTCKGAFLRIFLQQRAKLAQKLRCRKGSKNNFCDKVFVGRETLLCDYFIFNEITDCNLSSISEYKSLRYSDEWYSKAFKKSS